LTGRLRRLPPGTFDIRVAPVRAGQDTRIRLVYLQPIAIDHGIGRYVYPLEEGGVDEAKLAFWTASTEVQERFRFDLRLRSGYPVETVLRPDDRFRVVTFNNSARELTRGYTPATAEAARAWADRVTAEQQAHPCGIAWRPARDRGGPRGRHHPDPPGVALRTAHSCCSPPPSPTRP